MLLMESDCLSFSLFCTSVLNSILYISSRPIKQRLVLLDKVFFESLENYIIEPC